MGKVEKALAAALGVRTSNEGARRVAKLNEMYEGLKGMTWEERCEFNAKLPKRNEKAVNELTVALEVSGRTMEELTAHGMGVELGQWCLRAGVSASGTSRQKAERLVWWLGSYKI